MTTLPAFTSGTPGNPRRYDLTGVDGLPLTLLRLHDIVITGGRFASIYLSACQRIDISGFDLDAPAYPTSNGQAVRISNCTDIDVHDARLRGALATVGVAQSAKVLDKTGNVIGLPCGKAVNIDKGCSDVTVERLVISGFHKGVVLAGQRIKVLR